MQKSAHNGKYLNLYNELVSFLKDEGVLVKLVGHDTLHDYAGINWIVARQLGLDMPKNTIYVLKDLPVEVRFRTLRHEAIEVKRMEEGESYWAAHVYSLRQEKEPATRIGHLVKAEQ